MFKVFFTITEVR